jgi:prepilin-type N-terminal cleavage/methylation domain-containing protein/prepilin-type processing-associated H-X9-DG protein
MRRQKGFTLIELLVVIAIIAILAAILFPVFARAREKARQASCSSNQKQIALGLLMYAQDYDEAFPGFYQKATTADWPLLIWIDAIMPYVKNDQLFRCPSGNDSSIDPGTHYAGTKRLTTSYAVNRYVCNGGRDPFNNRMAQITAPAQTLLTFDAIRGARWCATPMGTGGSSGDDCYGRPAGIIEVSGGSLVAGQDYGLHNNGANVSFCDGHVKWMKSGAWESYAKHYSSYWQKTR